MITWLIARAEIDRRNRKGAMPTEVKPNLKPSAGNPVFWIWWLIGGVAVIGAIKLVSFLATAPTFIVG